MQTYRSMIYMVFDELKINSDDSVWETDHVVFLLNKYRAFLLKQRYKDLKKDVPFQAYQQLLVEMGDSTILGTASLSKSKKTIPNIINFNGIELESSVSPVLNGTVNNFTYDFNLITIDRFKYIGINKWIKNCIYCAFDYSKYLLMKSSSDVTLPSEAIVNAVLDDPRDIINFMDEKDIPEDLIDLPFPIEEAQVTPILELVIKELGTANYLPEDGLNNAKDDFTSTTNNG